MILLAACKFTWLQLRMTIYLIALKCLDSFAGNRVSKLMGDKSPQEVAHKVVFRWKVLVPADSNSPPVLS